MQKSQEDESLDKEGEGRKSKKKGESTPHVSRKRYVINWWGDYKDQPDLWWVEKQWGCYFWEEETTESRSISPHPATSITTSNKCKNNFATLFCYIDRVHNRRPSGLKITCGSISHESETSNGSQDWTSTRTAADQSRSCWRWRPAPLLPFKGNNKASQKESTRLILLTFSVCKILS